MKCIVKNKTNQDLTSLIDVIQDFFPHVQKKMGFKKPVKVNLVSDIENSKDIFGKTAFYEPSKHSITLFIDNRHPKDVLRSLSHELVHHAQNCRGDFDKMASTEPGYAQKDPHLRKMEAEAYLLGNGFLFRDYEDYIKQQRLTENKKMIRIDRTILENLVRETLNEVLNEGFTPSNPNMDKEPVGQGPSDIATMEEDLDENDPEAGGLEEDMDEQKVQHINMEPMHFTAKPKLMKGYAKIVKDKNHPKHKEAKKQLAARRAWNKTASGKRHLAKGGARKGKSAVAKKKSGDGGIYAGGVKVLDAKKRGHDNIEDASAEMKKGMAQRKAARLAKAGVEPGATKKGKIQSKARDFSDVASPAPKSTAVAKDDKKPQMNENVDHRSNKEWYDDELFNKLTKKWTK